jgi:hypothetical protein
MRQPIIGSSPNWPRKSRDAPCVWFDRAGRNQLVVTRCGPLRSRFRSDPVGMSRCPHAAAPPSSVMNSRRRMCALKSRDRTYHIVDAKNALCVEPINVRYARWSGLSVDGGPLPSLLRVSDAGRWQRCGLHRGRRPEAFNEGTRGKWQAVGRRAPSAMEVCAPRSWARATGADECVG